MSGVTVGEIGTNTSSSKFLDNYLISNRRNMPVILSDREPKLLRKYHVTNRSDIPVTLKESDKLFLNDYIKSPKQPYKSSLTHILGDYTTTPIKLDDFVCPDTTPQKTQCNEVGGSDDMLLDNYDINTKPPVNVVHNKAIDLKYSTTLYLNDYRTIPITKLTETDSDTCIQGSLNKYTVPAHATLKVAVPVEKYYWNGIIYNPTTNNHNRIIKVECGKRKYLIGDNKIYELLVNKDKLLQINMDQPNSGYTITKLYFDDDTSIETTSGFQVKGRFSTKPDEYILDIQYGDKYKLPLSVMSNIHAGASVTPWTVKTPDMLKEYEHKPIVIPFSPPGRVIGDYYKSSARLTTDIDGLIKKVGTTCNSPPSAKTASSSNTNIDILMNILKKQKPDICCDDIDLSKHVLKTSIVPCSNLIPEKYKKYAKKYKAGEESGDVEQVDIHKANVEDIFSISFIASIILLVVTILMKLL